MTGAKIYLRVNEGKTRVREGNSVIRRSADPVRPGRSGLNRRMAFVPFDGLLDETLKATR